MSFESIIDLTAFSIRIPQKDAEKLPEVGGACCGRGRGWLGTSRVSRVRVLGCKQEREFPLRVCTCPAPSPQILMAVPEQRRQEMRRNMAKVWQRCGGAWDSRCGQNLHCCCCSSQLPLPNLPHLSSPDCCRFTYSSYRPFAKRFKELQQDNAAGGGGAGEPKSLPATVPDLDPTADDAFRTIIAWLHSRIPDTRDAL